LAQTRTGSIAGTLRYTDGTPVLGLWVFVTAVPGTGSPGYVAFPVDNMGRYRGANIPAGQYHVKAGGMCQLGVECPINAPTYVFYPGTAAQEAATVVSVAAGAELEGVDFTFTTGQVMALEQAASQLGKKAVALWGLRSSAPSETPSWSSLDDMHQYYVAKFIATPGMGSGRMGGMMLELDPQKRLLLSTHRDGKTRREAWTVETLDLIGIAKHEQPVVFSRVAHAVYTINPRKLTEFEQRSLAELRLGKEVVVGRDIGKLLLVGAIRAKASCMSCHSDHSVGELLGAFRYVLQNPPTASPTRVEKP